MVYGHGAQPIPVAVGAREFQIAMSGEAGLNTLLSLEVGKDNFLTLARDIQHHPFKNVVTHVDFLIVRRDEVISAEITINLVGEAIEVQHGDGIVDQQLFTLHIKAKPADIPPSVDIDISGLTIGASLHVSDITIPAGVELETDLEATVVAGQPPRVQVTAEEEAETAAAAAAEAGVEPAAGDARPTPSRRRAKSCSATGALRGPRGREPRSTSWWSGWATREASSPAPATTSAPRWPRPLADRHGGRLKPEKGLRSRGRRDPDRRPPGARGRAPDLHERIGAGGGPPGPAGRHRPARQTSDAERRLRALRAGLIVVHDELDLPSGRVKVKSGGGTAGNNGLKSIDSHLHTNEYLRVRVGIGKPPAVRPAPTTC